GRSEGADWAEAVSPVPPQAAAAASVPRATPAALSTPRRSVRDSRTRSSSWNEVVLTHRPGGLRSHHPEGAMRGQMSVLARTALGAALLEGGASSELAAARSHEEHE